MDFHGRIKSGKLESSKTLATNKHSSSRIDPIWKRIAGTALRADAKITELRSEQIQK
jgi:hypothetical protein